MQERDVESRFRKAVKECGCLCLKFVSPGYTGVPDRIVLIPGGRLCFVELKAPGKKERPRQRYVQGMLRKMGFEVFSSVDDKRLPEVVARIRGIAECGREVRE